MEVLCALASRIGAAFNELNLRGACLGTDGVLEHVRLGRATRRSASTSTPATGSPSSSGARSPRPSTVPDARRGLPTRSPTIATRLPATEEMVEKGGGVVVVDPHVEAAREPRSEPR